MKKILFAAQNFRIGGVQTSLINLLNVLSEKYKDEYEIDVFVFGDGELLSHIPENVNVIYGKRALRLAATPFYNVIKEGGICDIVLRVILMLRVRVTGSEKFYKRLFEKQTPDKKYDVAISYFNDVPGNYFNRGTNLFVTDYTDAESKVAWIHNDPEGIGFGREETLAAHRDFDRIICVSGAVKEKFDRMFPEYADRTEVVHNMFSQTLIRKRADEYDPFEKNGFDIVTVARIDNRQKRINGIVELCKRLKDDGVTSFKWRIVGSGPDLKRNVKLAEKYGVTDVLEFVGDKVNPYPYIKKSDLFALYSAYEGFPMVIGETLALGTSIITTDYAAAKEQLGGTSAVIAKNDEDFYLKLKSMIDKK